jgi:putative ATP-dependent endonuclease of OLD family
LPIFIKEYFGIEAANLGISVVGVGGKNYYPFIKLLNAIQTKWFIFSDGESATITDLRRILKKLKQTEALPELADYPNIIVLDNANNFESYLQEQGYDAEIIASINVVEAGINSEVATPYFDYFIEKHHGESLSPRSTGRSCEMCGQIIKESPFRDYKSADGQQRALKDCMKAGKTKYASAIVSTICTTCDINRKFPPKIKLLLDSINAELEI